MKQITKRTRRWLLLALTLSSSAWASGAAEVSVITSNRNLWNYSAQELTQRFSDLDWKSIDQGYKASSAKGLLFWDQKINSIIVEGNRNTAKLSVEIYNKENMGDSGTLSDARFRSVASQWKQMLDEKSGVGGVALSKMRQKEREVQYVTWKLNDATVVLAAEWERSPKSITLEIHPHSYGKNLTATLKNALKGDDVSDKPGPKAADDSVIAKALKKKTYYLSGSNLKKNDISGAPKYYLVYFSASW